MKTLKTIVVASLAAIVLVACATDSEKSDRSKEKESKQPAATQPAAQSEATPTPSPGTNGALGHPEIKATPVKPEDPDKDPKEAKENGDAASDGAHLYTEMGCDKCHGSNGKGKLQSAPDFSNKELMAGKPKQEMMAAIKSGKGVMPPYGGRLNDSQIKSLVSFVRSFSK